MRRLPEWVMTNKFPSVYDTESGTAIEMVAKVYGAMQGVVDEHNKIAEETEKQIDAFEKETTDNITQFENNMTHIMSAHIKSVDDTINILHESQKEEIENAVEDFISENPENMEPIINQWLDEHPEATTTVQDHSLTIDKMVVGSLGYVTPQMYGAVGDGVADDTNAFIQAFASGVKSLYIPEGSYRITSKIDVPIMYSINGAGSRATNIICESDCFNFTNVGASTTIKDLCFTVKDVEKNYTVIYGNFQLATFENVRIYGGEYGFKFGDHTWSNNFIGVIVTYSKYGIYYESNFNNNNFYGCVFQSNDYCVYADGGATNLLFSGCNIEKNTVGLSMQGVYGFKLADSYCEGNTKIIEIRNGSYNSEWTIEDCWLYGNGNNWLCELYSTNNVNVNPSTILFSKNHIVHSENYKPIGFAEGGTMSFIAVCFSKNRYTAGVNNYFDLVDTTNCQDYLTISNELPVYSDVPIAKLGDTCYCYMDVKGNTYPVSSKFYRRIINGYYAVTSTGTSTVSIPIRNCFGKTTGYVVGTALVLYEGGVQETKAVSVQINELRITVDSSKKVTGVVLNCDY